MNGSCPFPVPRPDDPRAGLPGSRVHEVTGPKDRRFHFGLPLPDEWGRPGDAGHAATEETYDRRADRLAIAAAGLRFLEPGTWHCAEALGTLVRRSPSVFLVFHPDSWRVGRPHAAGADVYSASLVNRLQDRVVGRSDLAVVSRGARPDLRAVVDDCLARLTAAGFEGPPIPFAPIPPPAAFDVAWEGVGERTSGDARVELRLRAGQRPEAWF